MRFLIILTIFFFINLFTPAYSQSDDERRNQYEQEKQKIEELENNAKYHGDDEIIRKRTNLPPKLPSFEVWLKNQEIYVNKIKNIEEKSIIPIISKEEEIQKEEIKQPIVQTNKSQVEIIKNDAKKDDAGIFDKTINLLNTFWSSVTGAFSATVNILLGILGFIADALYFIFIIGVVLFPVTILLYFEVTNPTTSTFKKVREFPVEAFILMASGIALMFLFLPLGVITLIYGVGIFVNDGLGCFINYDKDELTLPAFCKEADSFFSYLNPMILFRPFYRVTVNLHEITNASLWSERSIEEDSQGKLKVKVVNKVQISSLHGSYVRKYRSTAKCERLISLLNPS
jgi:hypothetical protein